MACIFQFATALNIQLKNKLGTIVADIYGQKYRRQCKLLIVCDSAFEDKPRRQCLAANR